MNVNNSFGYGSFRLNYGLAGNNRLNSTNTSNKKALPDVKDSNVPSFVGKIWSKEELIADFENQIAENASLKKQKIADAPVSNSLPNASSSNTHVLHWELDEDCEKLVGASFNCRSGKGITVLKPKDFDEENPIYKVKTWDDYGNMEEKYIKVADVDPKNADYDEMFAYTSYLSDSGKYPDAQQRFMMSRGIEESVRDFNGVSRDDLYDAKTNWVEIVKKAMDMQFNCGNKNGFLKFKSFWEYLNNPDNSNMVA